MVLQLCDASSIDHNWEYLPFSPNYDVERRAHIHHVPRTGRTMIRSSFPRVLIVFLVAILPIRLVSSKITPARVATFIDSATSYLIRISHTADQDPMYPGSFTYIAHIGRDLQLDGFDSVPQTSYNLLRHNGAIYSLSQSYHRKPDERIKAAMVRGIGYLKTIAMGPVPDVEKNDGSVILDMLAPWEVRSGGDQDDEDPPMRAKLGGAGLGLIALCTTERVAPGTTELEYMRQIGNFIEFLQKEDGSFISRFDSKTGRDDTWVSLYYPGEAALGLIYLFELETNDKLKTQWLKIATQTLLYLEGLRRFKPFKEIEPDHWALLATSRLLPYLDKSSVEYWLVYEHAMRVIRSMLLSISEEELVESKGCFTRDRRTCPTATRLEGLLASLTVVKDYEMFIDMNGNKVVPLRERMIEYIELGVDFLLGAQQIDDMHDMKGAVPIRSPIERDSDGLVRVDYVQHSMSAVLAYETLMSEPRQTYMTFLAEVSLFAGAFILLFILILLLLPDRVMKSRRYYE